MFYNFESPMYVESDKTSTGSSPARQYVKFVDEIGSRG
jgi:hypothetical protein